MCVQGIISNLGEWLTRINNAVWGIPLVLAIIAVGLYFTFGLGFVQFKNIRRSFGLLFNKSGQGEGAVSSFGALMTSLAAMIGTGNIVGVAAAVASGGAGAIVWMLLASLVGMATSYAEGVLAIKYRHIRKDGTVLGGAFMYIERGMGRKFIPLAKLFAFLCCAAAVLGMGTLTQVNGIASAMTDLIDSTETYRINILGMNFPLIRLICAVCVTALAAKVVFGGVAYIAEVSERVVPIMGSLYVLATLSVLVFCADKIPDGISRIISGAFTGNAVLGGFCGTGVAQAIRIGVSRGIFSNEAGLGSASIAAAAAQVEQPAEQGLVSMIGTFIDTTVLCTMTGLAIVVSGALDSGLSGVSLTNLAYSAGFPFATWLGRTIVSVSLVLFAFASILGWNYYGEQSAEYLAGKSAVPIYRVIYLAAVFAGCFLEMKIVWDVADILNGLMAIPNLIALCVLYPVVKRESQRYFNNKRR